MPRLCFDPVYLGPLSHLPDSNQRPSDYKSEALPTELRGLFSYFLIKESFAVESVQTESLQIESLQVESLEVVEVEFEHAAKVTNAAINNTFFILI